MRFATRPHIHKPATLRQQGGRSFFTNPLMLFSCTFNYSAFRPNFWMRQRPVAFFVSMISLAE
ncbi:hypothetical protein B4168_3711 [Anoxybacillus flavithermus]|nr:hypothetical protein B4168_3711 [Anoxybacillus flavithermus]OAO88103.1 hypothetical protein GT23_0836 [Parageobacillus thermoglucosidasius]